MTAIVVVTGPGISRDSALLKFPDTVGMWHRQRHEKPAIHEAFVCDPALAHTFYNEWRAKRARGNKKIPARRQSAKRAKAAAPPYKTCRRLPHCGLFVSISTSCEMYSAGGLIAASGGRGRTVELHVALSERPRRFDEAEHGNVIRTVTKFDWTLLR